MPITRSAKILDAVKHERSDFTRLMLIHTQCFSIVSEPQKFSTRILCISCPYPVVDVAE